MFNKIGNEIFFCLYIKTNIKMHRRKRIRKQNMPSLMDIDSSGIGVQPYQST